MTFLIRFLLSIVISSIIYPVTMLQAGRSLLEIQRKRYQKTNGLQKPQLTKTQRITSRKKETENNRTYLQAAYNAALIEAKAGRKMTLEERVSNLSKLYEDSQQNQ